MLLVNRLESVDLVVVLLLDEQHLARAALAEYAHDLERVDGERLLSRFGPRP